MNAPKEQSTDRSASQDRTKRSIRDILNETWRFFRSTPYAVKSIWQFEPKLLLLLGLSAMVDGISPTVSVWIMRYFLDAAVIAFQHPGKPEYIKPALFMLALQVIATGGFACVNRGLIYFRGVLSRRLSLHMQADVIQGISRLRMTDFDNPEIHDMITRAKSEAENNKPLSIVSGLCDIVSSLITWVSFSLVLLTLSSLAVLGMFAVCIPYFILNIYFSRLNFELQYKRTQEQRAISYFSSCFTDRRCLPEMFARDLWSFLAGKWKTGAARFMGQDILLMKRRTNAELGVIAFAFLGRGCVSLFIVYKCLTHLADYTLGQLTMFLQAFSGGIGALFQLMQQLSSVYEGSCFLQNYQKFVEMQPAPATVRRTVPEIIECIEYRNVSFIYPGASDYSLRHINVVFRKGESTLLVGCNGAGKTTLARLMIGLYAPTEGQILVNGYDVAEYDMPLLRKKMSVIFQDFVRYALTAEENIGLGAVEQMPDRQKIVEAAKRAQVDGVIARLPQGYETMLGKEFRDGQDLSLGEWQRVCLARLFMRNASVFLYDEPSASLDVETESELLRNISSRGHDAICVLISHRMLRADIADRVLVLEKGRMVEQGSHHELLQLNGRYARLWKMYHQLGDSDESAFPSLPGPILQPLIDAQPAPSKANESSVA